VLVMSIDTTDKPVNAVGEKKTFLSEAGWTNNPAAANAVHFLTSAQPSIDAITGATGFHYVRVPGPGGKMDQFAHSSVIMFATPDGRMSRYLAGIDYPARDMRLALLQAGDKKISNPVDLLILYCCNYSPSVGRYSVSIVRILGIAGMITLLVVAGMIFLLTRKPKSLQGPVTGHFPQT
jgi:protein SCO1/2